MKKPAIETFFAVTILSMWVMAILLDAFNPAYEIPGTVQTAFAAATAYYFGRKWLEPKEKKNDQTDTRGDGDSKSNGGNSGGTGV